MGRDTTLVSVGHVLSKRLLNQNVQESVLKTIALCLEGHKGSFMDWWENLPTTGKRTSV